MPHGTYLKRIDRVIKLFRASLKPVMEKSTFLDAQKTLFLYIMMDLDCHFSRISFKHFIHLRLLLSYLYI